MWSAASTEALKLSVVVAVAATVAIVLAGVPISLWLVRRRGAGVRLLDAVLALPLVVPPVVTGYCLLLILGPRGPLGRVLEAIGVRFVFDWKGAVVAAGVMAMPLFLVTAKVAFQRCSKDLEDAARTLNAGPLRVFFTITLPLAGPGLLAAAAVAFARAFGEFGATMMLAGNIPGQTRTVPQAIYTDLIAQKDSAALALILVSVAVGIASMVASQMLMRFSTQSQRAGAERVRGA